MTQDNLIEFKTPDSQTGFSDALSDLVRQGARQIIAQDVEAKLSEFLGQYRGLKDDSGRQAVVRNGYLPSERSPPELVRSRYRCRKCETAAAAALSSTHCCYRRT
jgi:hypothetical protein